MPAYLAEPQLLPSKSLAWQTGCLRFSSCDHHNTDHMIGRVDGLVMNEFQLAEHLVKHKTTFHVPR